MKGRIFFWSITSALAGFLFGFDTVVISGAEQTIQALWGLSSTTHGIAMASALYGTVIGSMLGGWPTDRFGRKATLTGVGVLYILSAVGCGFATGVEMFIVARLIGGIGIGISTVTAPLYISEISPPERRGRLAGLFQFNIVFGILVAFASNWILSKTMSADLAWRWMLGIAAIPSVIYSVMCFALPESPRWLITCKGDRAGGLKILKLIDPEASDADLNAKADEILAQSATSTGSERFWTRNLRIPIMLAILIAFFNQFSGINAILYFAPRIFQMAGMEAQASMLQSVGIGLANLIFTFVGLYLIDRLGRRTLLYIGSVGYIASLALTGIGFMTETYSIIPWCIFAFIASHAVGQGAVIFVYISEIFPNRHRANGQALGTFTHWICAALITSVFPMAAKALEGQAQYIFFFFSGMMVLQLIWVKLMVRETKGVSLEDMHKQMGVTV